LADDEPGRLLRDRVRHLRAELLERSGGLLAREVLERAGDDVGVAGERALGRLVLRADLEAEAEPAKLLDERAILLVVEPLGDRLGAVGADPVDLGDVLLRRAE